MRWFYRGRHRRTRFSITVTDLVWECTRIPIDEVFARRNALWAGR